MTQKDQRIVRELAKQYREMACSEKQQRMNQRMRACNDLTIVRPPVLIDEIPWYQMDIDGELTCLCEDERARKAEARLRQSLFRWKYFKADTLFEPFWRVPIVMKSSGTGMEAEESILRTDNENNIVSHHYSDVLENESALDEMRIPTFWIDEEKTERAMSFYGELFGDALPVRKVGYSYCHSVPWDTITNLRGVEPIMMDMYDRPEYLHRTIRFFTDCLKAKLDFVEKHLPIEPNLADMHCTPAMVSGLAQSGFGATWFRGAAQSFGIISPAMFREFEVAYMKPIAERFAYTYYGCCEPLDNKIDVLKEIKNLRKLGVSPWASVEVCAEQIGRDYVLSAKPNPANVAIQTDAEQIRREIERIVQAAIKHQCPCELVLKDISTVSHRPENLILWADTVSEVLDQYYGEA